MKIVGLQKLSLVDFDGHISCTVFTSGCNFACPFCHNSPLVIGHEKEIPESEIFEYLIKRKGIIDSICISGGEPTLQPDLIEFIRKVKNLGLLVKLDSNGTNPNILSQLLSENLLDYVAMDIKNSLDNYDAISGKSVNVDNIKKSIDLLINSQIDYEFRTTLISEFHSERDIREISKNIKGCKKYFLQKFVDSGSCIKNGLHEVPKAVAENYIDILSKNIQNVFLRGY